MGGNVCEQVGRGMSSVVTVIVRCCVGHAGILKVDDIARLARSV